MQPNDQIPHPIDYLDSISTAPKQQGARVNDKLFFGVIIGAVAIILSVVILMITTSGPSTVDEMSTLSVRLQNLQEVSTNSRNIAVSSSLRATNTNLSLALANANRDIQEPLSTRGIEPKKISASPDEEENMEELSKTLEDARLNGIFDRIYAREMTYELGTLIALISQLEERTKDEEKEFFTKLRTDLEPLQKQFSNFSAAS